jgi:gliding motility-associated lipoprotein GldD
MNVPKPRGHFRIDLPAKEYVKFNPDSSATGKPFSFEYPRYGYISTLTDSQSDPGWLNIEFPQFKAKIYLTYKAVSNNLESLMEQTFQMNVKNHIIKAEAINEQMIQNPQNKVYGILYDLKGNTASAVQFYVTDSINHYLRGSLYFTAEPNADSLSPVINFFREDIIHFIETLEWKKN